MMARGAKLDEVKRSSIRIPMSVCERIDFLMDSVRSRILDAACSRAEARQGPADANRVTEQDCLQAASEVLQQTAEELERLLTKSVSRDARVRNTARRIA